MTVEASVYEPLSGKTLSGSSQTPVESTDYQVTFMDINSKSYREGQKYTCYVSYSQRILFDLIKPSWISVHLKILTKFTITLTNFLLISIFLTQSSGDLSVLFQCLFWFWPFQTEVEVLRYSCFYRSMFHVVVWGCQAWWFSYRWAGNDTDGLPVWR